MWCCFFYKTHIVVYATGTNQNYELHQKNINEKLEIKFKEIYMYVFTIKAIFK